MEKSLDWNEKCPGDEIENKNNWKSRKFSVILKIKKKKWKIMIALVFDMLLFGYWKTLKKKIGQ
jgi:hypothetical protein